MPLIHSCYSLVGVLALAVGFSAAASAQEGRPVAYEETSEAAEISELRSRISALEQQLDASLSAPGACGCCECGCGSGCSGCCGCGDCGCGCSCCQTCCDCCCPAAVCCPCGWQAGFEAVWLQPTLKDNNAFTSFIATPTGIGQQQTVTPFDYDFEFSPRVWLGYTGCSGVGIRGSWWESDQAAERQRFRVPVLIGGFNFATGRLVFANEGELLTSMQTLNLEMGDLELTHCINIWCSRGIVSCGARYIYYGEYTREEVFDVNGLLDERARFQEGFEGVGPTLAMELLTPVTTNLAVYTNVRGSVAFGDATLWTLQEFFNNANQLTGSTVTTREATESQAVVEAQIALQWNYGPWYLRAGWQVQYWDDADEGNEFFPNPQGFSINRSDIGVHGFSVSGGYGG